MLTAGLVLVVASKPPLLAEGNHIQGLALQEGQLLHSDVATSPCRVCRSISGAVATHWQGNLTGGGGLNTDECTTFDIVRVQHHICAWSQSERATESENPRTSELSVQVPHLPTV
jgi:hypothetical protein